MQRLVCTKRAESVRNRVVVYLNGMRQTCVGKQSAFTAMRRWRLSRDQFCIFWTTFVSAVYKTCTRRAK